MDQDGAKSPDLIRAARCSMIGGLQALSVLCGGCNRRPANYYDLLTVIEIELGGGNQFVESSFQLVKHAIIRAPVVPSPRKIVAFR